jgi:ribosomal protein S18 acetylase RimI-like enzyme
VRIRPAKTTDVEAMSAIAKRAYGGYVELIGARPHPMDDDYAEKVAQGHTLVAEDGEALVGLLVLVHGDDHLLLENVAVDPNSQGEGIGRVLLDHAEATARELRLPVVRLYTNAAMTRNLEMYRRRGYREDARETINGFNRVFLSKRVM